MSDSNISNNKPRGFRITSLKTSKSKVEEGVWHDGPDGLRLRVRHSSSAEYQVSLRRKLKPYDRAVRKQKFDDPGLVQATREAIAESLLLDWENVTDDNGNLIPYSREKALEFLVDIPEFAQMVLDCANDSEAYGAEATEASAKA